MKKPGSMIRVWGTAVTMLFLIVSLTAATFAWFSANRVVNTDMVSTRSGSSSLELQVSAVGGGAFRGSQEAEITQVNRTSRTGLLPVSTADLKTFVYNPATTDGNASSFRTVTDEEYYYHGRIYLRALAEGQPQGSRMALYLDQSASSGGALVSANSGLLLNAARLGIVFENQAPVIFRLSNGENSASDRAYNTVLNGQKLGADKVLNGTGGTVRQADDPSILPEVYSIRTDGETVLLPEQPLLYMELNRIYQADIYFYLEGCDPDCLSDKVALSKAALNLAFYGLLTY